LFSLYVYKGNGILIWGVERSIVPFRVTMMKCSQESEISSQCDTSFWTAMNPCLGSFVSFHESN